VLRRRAPYVSKTAISRDFPAVVRETCEVGIPS
jgi:hypothetical protein